MDALAKSHYQVLGVRTNATAKDIKKAYKRLALEMHSDENPGHTMEATRAFQALQQAHETLTNPQKRAKYDLQRTGVPENQETDPDSSGGSLAMSEEDVSESEFGNYEDFLSATEKPDVSTWTITAIKDLKILKNVLVSWGAAIRARVTHKTDVNRWENQLGKGTLFSMDLLDDSGEIRMTGFSNSVDLFYDMIKVNQEYYIRCFNVKPANKQFTSIQHDCELSFNGYTEVIPCEEEPMDIPQPEVTYNFVSIAHIEHVDVGKVIDVLGVCKSVADCQNITVRRTGRELKKRDLVLMDLTCKKIVLTLWGKTAEDFSDDTQPMIIAVKGVKVSDVGGKSLSCLTSSAFKVNPDLAEAHALRKWYESEGSSLTAQSLSSAR